MALSRALGRVGIWFLRILGSAPLRTVIILAVDAFICVCGLLSAMYLRFGLNVEEPYASAIGRMTVLLVSARLLANLGLRVHRWSFLQSSLPDAFSLAMAGLLGTGLFMIGIFLLRVQPPPRSVVALELLLSTSAMGFLRFAPRIATTYVAESARSRRGDSYRAIIIGAGGAGEMLWRDLRRSDFHGNQVLGFLDDDRGKHGLIIGGREVLGSIADLPEMAARHGINKVLIAIPRLPALRIREIVGMCSTLKLRFQILPLSRVYLEAKVSASMLHDLTPEDLLQRGEVRFEQRERLVTHIGGKRVLVTGAAGSIGTELCQQLTGLGPSEIVMLDINENGLYLLARRLERPPVPNSPVRITPVLADVRDALRIERVFGLYRPDHVFHAAAHKHVPMMEGAPCEAVKNNVIGTQNVVRAAELAGAKRFVFISTDKAVNPTSVMGATKRVGEMIIRARAENSNMALCAVRFGNVLGSAGSVVPLFREQIACGGPVSVTHPDVRRYFMTVSEAVGLVLVAAYSDAGELYVLEMGEQVKILDLAKSMITMAGLTPNVDIPIVMTGLRPGEKLAEEMMMEDSESSRPIGEKIHVVDGRPPSLHMDDLLYSLARAAESEVETDVVAILRNLVPTYAPDPALFPMSQQELPARNMT